MFAGASGLPLAFLLYLYCLHPLFLISLPRGLHAPDDSVNPQRSVTAHGWHTMIDLALEERLDDLDPLRHLREDAGSDEDSAGTIVPVQPPSVRNQTIELAFAATPDIGRVAIKLAVDASPGCGGIAWPAGEVSCILAVRGVNVCLNAPS